MLLVAAGNASLWTGPTGNNTYLFRGAVATLIDAGVGNPAHVAAISSALGEQPLALLLITHGHPDHIAGIPAMKSRWPAVAVRNVPPDSCWDGESIPAGDGALRAIYTPGHAPDHFCFFEESSGDLYCGDLARLGGTIVIPAGSGGDLTQYLASLRRVLALGPRRLLPGHGPIVTDPAALLQQYLQHREDREGQILDAVREGRTTVARIVERVYGPIASELVRAASETVRAHLNKLQQEGRLSVTGEDWREP